MSLANMLNAAAAAAVVGCASVLWYRGEAISGYHYWLACISWLLTALVVLIVEKNQ
jgi:hypothetical protein